MLNPMPPPPLPAIAAFLLAIIATFAVSGVAAAGAIDTLDQFCGGALSSPGCVETVAAYPVETGALVAIIEAEKSKFGSADDCQNKLSVGTAMFSEIAPYVSDVGGDISQIVKASCIIAFSTKTCSGEAQKIAGAATDAVAWALKQLDSLLGLDDTPTGPTLEQNLAEYWATVYQPMERPMIGVPDSLYIETANQLDQKCLAEWWVTNEDEFAVCRLGFTKRFHTEVDALRAQYRVVVGEDQARHLREAVSRPGLYRRHHRHRDLLLRCAGDWHAEGEQQQHPGAQPVSYTHLRAHETGRNLV